MSRIKDLQKQVFKVLADTDEPMKAMAHLSLRALEELASEMAEKE